MKKVSHRLFSTAASRQKALRSALLFALTFTITFAPSASAVVYLPEDVIDRYANNNILFTDPCSGMGSGMIAGGGTFAEGEFVDTGDNTGSIIGYLQSAGYDTNAIAGIIGNLYGESGAFNPLSFEGGENAPLDFVAYKNGSKTFKGGFGIAQWTSAGRVKNLQDYANSKGLPVTSLEAQTGFLVQELSGYGYSPANLNGRSIEETTYEILRNYETPRSIIDVGKPSSYTDLPAGTRAADEFQKRLNYGFTSLGITPTDMPASPSMADLISAIFCLSSGNDIATMLPGAGDVNALQQLVLDWAWETYGGQGFTSKKAAYDAIIQNSRYKGGNNGVDCGAFVYNLMVQSGWDPNYVAGNTSAQKNYLANNWVRVGQGGSAQLQPGDVGIRDGHVKVYVGNIAGFGSTMASASYSTKPGRGRAPMADAESESDARYTWYRKP